MSASDESRAERDRADARVLERLRRGEVEAASELFDRHGAAAFGLARRIVRDPAEAEDVVQDAFVAIVTRAGQYLSERGTVAAWLLTTVRNLAVDRMRRRRRRERIVERELRHEPPPASPEPGDSLTRTADTDRLRRALATLPDAQRETLESAFFDGLTYPEIAARDDVPIGTIKSRAARGLHALRALLAEPESL